MTSGPPCRSTHIQVYGVLSLTVSPTVSGSTMFSQMGTVVLAGPTRGYIAVGDLVHDGQCQQIRLHSALEVEVIVKLVDARVIGKAAKEVQSSEPVSRVSGDATPGGTAVEYFNAPVSGWANTGPDFVPATAIAATTPERRASRLVSI